jgi:hypothetical protein
MDGIWGARIVRGRTAAIDASASEERMIIALSSEFLLAFSNVQKSHQKKVREFFEKFQVHPEI